MILAHKIELTPTDTQDTYFRKACGTARFAYNWGLATWKEQYQDGQKPSAFGLKKQFNAIKKQVFPWTGDVTKCASEGAFTSLGKAFTNFFAGRAGYPKFKKKGVHDSFALNNDQFRLDECRVKIPKLGWVKMTESLRFSGKILAGTVSRIADTWFLSISVKVSTVFDQCNNHAAVGVDVGIKELASLSTGDMFPNPRPLKMLERQLKRLQRQLNKKKKGSKNREKAKMKIARLHYRISCIRKDAIHKLTRTVTKHFKHIAIEDLNVKGMVRNHKLAKALSDSSLSEILRQLTYKAELYGNVIHKVNRFFPSSKLCSRCGHKYDGLTLKDRTFICPSCGMTEDRDVNAAINLRNQIGKVVPEFTPAD